MSGALICVNHINRASCVNLDGDELCQECADAWVRSEGSHQAWLEVHSAQCASPRSPSVPQDDQ